MIRRNADQADCVFSYAFRPIDSRFFCTGANGGFSIALYFDDILSVKYYNRVNGVLLVVYEINFRMSETLKHDLLTMIDNASWLAEVPDMIWPEQNNNGVRFTHSFGFNGYPLIVSQDLPHMMHRPMVEHYGRSARRLCCLFEDICERLERDGIILRIEMIDYDRDKIHPLNDGYYHQTAQTMNASAEDPYRYADEAGT